MRGAVMVTVKLRLPAPTSVFVMNLLGLLGLAGIAVAVGGLTHNVWWALLVGAVECVTLSIVAAMNADGEATAAGETLARPRAA